MPRFDVILSLLLYSFGVYAFVMILILQARDSSECDRRMTPAGRSAHFLSYAIWGMTLLWFLDLTALTLLQLRPGFNTNALQIGLFVMQFAYPPMIMHVVYSDVRQQGGVLRSPWWFRPIVASYVVSGSIALWGLLIFSKVIAPGIPNVGAIIGISTAALFTLAAVYSVLAMGAAEQQRETPRERASRRWMIGLFGAMVVLCFLLVFGDSIGLPGQQIFRLVGTSMPLLFCFVAFYHEARFEFFDLFVKRGLALFVTVTSLSIYLAIALRLLEGFQLEGARAFVISMVLLPGIAAVPWLHRKLYDLLDNRWLGRRYSTVEAVKAFLAGLQEATTEIELAEAAERGLTAIFHAPVRIDLGLRQAPPLEFNCVRDIPIRSGAERVGALLMGQRANESPYFSEDVALLESLADVFSYMLENVRLRERKQEQDRQARELTLQASRSELKALRAQINPHFLFNALNAIAGLIHKDPFRADSTVEQLAEVFRYTLRGSEKEWARLEDEMEFVRAYLDVEQARFGARLQVRIDLDDPARDVRIPTMIVQTLVENAVKHGVAAVRGQARIEITAHCAGSDLVVEVADNGPGFPDTDLGSTAPAETAASSPNTSTKGASYGLRNIRERFRGYFGDRAGLAALRDEQRAMTIVRLTMPLRHRADQDGPRRDPGSAGVA